MYCLTRPGILPPSGRASQQAVSAASSARLLRRDGDVGVSDMRGEQLEDLLTRILENLGGRIGGPMTFRFVLQPLVASVLAIRAGLRDAQSGRPPYLWTILTSRQDRRHLLREGWRAVLNVFVVAVNHRSDLSAGGVPTGVPARDHAGGVWAGLCAQPVGERSREPARAQLPPAAFTPTGALTT